MKLTESPLMAALLTKKGDAAGYTRAEMQRARGDCLQRARSSNRAAARAPRRRRIGLQCVSISIAAGIRTRLVRSTSKSV